MSKAVLGAESEQRAGRNPSAGALARHSSGPRLQHGCAAYCVVVQCASASPSQTIFNSWRLPPPN